MSYLHIERGATRNHRFLPFELLYGREVWGPHVLKEEWESSPKSDEKIISHVLMGEKLECHLWYRRMSLKLQARQKNWYDHIA